MTKMSFVVKNDTRSGVLYPISNLIQPPDVYVQNYYEGKVLG